MDKEAQSIAPSTLAGIILVVMALILGVMFYLGIFGNQDLEKRDLCRLSILSRATLPGVVEQALSLNCYTEKICITTKDKPSLSPFAIFGGKKQSDCKQFAGEENFKDIYVKITGELKDQEETKRIIEKLYADVMYDCWTMTGQGKLDVFRGETSGTTEGIAAGLLDFAGSGLSDLVKTIKPKCIVCSRIALSDKLIEANEKLKKEKNTDILLSLDFNKFISREKVKGSGKTYLQTFTDDSVSGFVDANKNDLSSNVSIKPSVGANQIAMIFMQIKTDKSPGDLGEEAAYLTGTALLGGGLFTGVGRKAVFGTGAVGFIGSILVGFGSVGSAYLYASNVGEANQALSLGSCGAYTNEKDAKLGCSLIKSVKWDVNEINNLCLGGIGGNL